MNVNTKIYRQHIELKPHLRALSTSREVAIRIILSDACVVDTSKLKLDRGANIV